MNSICILVLSHGVSVITNVLLVSMHIDYVKRFSNVLNTINVVPPCSDIREGFNLCMSLTAVYLNDRCISRFFQN